MRTYLVLAEPKRKPVKQLPITENAGIFVSHSEERMDIVFSSHETASLQICARNLGFKKHDVFCSTTKNFRAAHSKVFN